MTISDGGHNPLAPLCNSKALKWNVCVLRIGFGQISLAKKELASEGLNRNSSCMYFILFLPKLSKIPYFDRLEQAGELSVSDP